MEQTQPTLEDIVQRSYIRALPAQKLGALIGSFVENKDYDKDALAHELCEILLDQICLDPSTLPTSYLSTCLSSSLLTVQTVLAHLLFRLATQQIPMAVLVAISGALLSASTGLLDGDTIPALLTPPPQLVPDIGASSPSPTSTLTLLMPLLRLCATPNTPLPIIALASRILSLLSPFPSPPLEVGVEASGLLPSLPESVFGPLRNCLAGLMADITLTQGVEQAAVAALGSLPPSKPAPGPSTTADITLPPLPRIWSSPHSRSPIPTQHGVSFALAYAHHSRPYAKPISNVPGLTSAHIAILGLGRYFEVSSERWLLHVLENAILGVMDSYPSLGPEYVEKMLFLVEELPSLLKWWKDHSDGDWIIPASLVEVLSTAFEVSSSSLSAYSTFMTETLEQRVSQAESEDELGGSYPVEGWVITSLQNTLATRLVELGLLNQEETKSLLPEFDITIPPNGESLVTRLANSSSSHFPPVEQIITTAMGAARAFANEFIQVIQDYPQKPLPDNLFTATSSLPSVLAALATTMPPVEVMQLLCTKLLDPPDDQSSRSEDPQGALTRFGESVVLVEAFAALFELPLPPLLIRSRSAIGFGDLPQKDKECMNGWAKALFGSDGIDDDILLSTAPADFCRLASTLIQQAISATAAGIIDRDTLHSGLSYFSQPLLSWSLGGILVWLCKEIERNGLISGLHLDVLQDLISSGVVSDALLRVAGKDIARLLDPIQGLVPVFTSANIDTTAIRQKLEGLGVRIEQTSLPVPPHENILRAELQLLRRLDVAPLNWSGNMLHSLQDMLRAGGLLEVATLLVDEALSQSSLPTMEGTFDPTTDPLAYFVPSLLSPPLVGDQKPMSSTFVNTILPSSLSQISSQSIAVPLLLKSSLVLSQAIDAGGKDGATRLVEHLIEDLAAIKEAKVGEKRVFGRKIGKEEMEIRKRNALALGRALANDDELRGRFAALTSLAE